jgi:methionine synthase I (cobalamin-dependent)
VLGGCCGTDSRHIGAMSRAWLASGSDPAGV